MIKKLEDCPRCCKAVHLVPSTETLAGQDDTVLNRCSIQHRDPMSRCNEAEPFRNATSYAEAVGDMGDKLVATWNTYALTYPKAKPIGVAVCETLVEGIRTLPENDKVKACVVLLETNDPAEPFRVLVSGDDDALGRILCKGWAVWLRKFDGEFGVEFAHCRFCGEVVREDDCLKSKSPFNNAIHRSCSLKRAYILTNPDARADGAQIFLADFDVPITCEICGEPMMTSEAIEPIAAGEQAPRCHSACKHPYHRARTEPED